MKRFKPHFDQFDLVKGAGRLVGRQALWEGAKALLKTGVVGIAVWMAIQGAIPLLSASGALPVSSVVSSATGVIVAILQSAIVAGIVLGALDVLVVTRRNRQHTMMTKQEIKDESKSTEGDPHIRQQRRSRAIQISRNRMMAAIPGADVVMLNPTHVAVALKYEPGKSAPRVIAKGAGEVAARIREKASEHRIPMVQDIPLGPRALRRVRGEPGDPGGALRRCGPGARVRDVAEAPRRRAGRPPPRQLNRRSSRIRISFADPQEAGDTPFADVGVRRVEGFLRIREPVDGMRPGRPPPCTGRARFGAWTWCCGR